MINNWQKKICRIYYREVVFMTDFLLVEQLHRMMGELPRPRLMYRKGIGMRGYFKIYRSFEEYTSADIFCEMDRSFPVRARFSALLGDGGTADTRRNIKGFAVRLYSGAGEYDVVCSSLPVFFINRSRDFLELAESMRCRAWFDGIAFEKFWRFVVKHPEALHCALRLFSSEGLTASYRRICWYSVHTCVWNNEKGEQFLVRYRWIPVGNDRNGLKEGDDQIGEERIIADFMAGYNPDAAQDDLETAVAEGAFPAFELWVQIMDASYSSHPEYQRRTVSWNEAIFPPVRAGILKLTEMEPLEQSEKLCFSPGHLGPGISLWGDEFSDFADYAHKAGGAERGVRT